MFSTSKFGDVVHIDVFVVPLIFGVDASNTLADGSPGEARSLLVWEKHDDATYTTAGSSGRDVFEGPANELVGVRIGLEALE